MGNKIKTSIQCSMGPASDSVDIIAAMMDAGMDVVRINLSHGTAISQADKYDTFLKALEKHGANDVKIMYDLCGPNVRVKELPYGVISCKEGEEIIFPDVNYENFYKDVIPGTEILVDDGLVRFVVTEIIDKDIHCKVTMGGDVKTHKGINVPSVKLRMPFLSEQDKEDILWCIDNQVDYIAASFVRRAEDIILLRDFLKDNGGKQIKLIAKIENREAIQNLEEITALTDLVLIARGDMGVEIGYENVPREQKRIIRICNGLGVPVIVATQMVDSMMHKKIPTRAEVSDIYNAVLDGADGLLVTGETTLGDYPVEVVKELVTVAEQAEIDMSC